MLSSHAFSTQARASRQPTVVHKVESGTQNKSVFKKLDSRNFPGGPVVKNLPCNAGYTGSIPSQGTKTPHARKQLSSQATTTEPIYHN